MPSIKVTLPTSDNSYEILIQEKLFAQIPSLLKKKAFGNRYAIITDHHVKKLYGKKLLENLKKEGLESDLFSFRAGERFKTLQTTEKLLEELLKKKFNRKDTILALGGGVAGDLAAFTASIFMRGIPYIHIPTTFLAMVDSSIGGKTGVDLTYGKNLAGTFYQPRAVWIDPELLKTLPKDQFLNGFGEIIKYGIIKDFKLFETLEKSIQENKKINISTLNKLIIQSAKIKATIIEKDEKESGQRMLPNYGHTVGHAIERLSEYKIEHGQAVALGIIIINKISLELDLVNKKDELRINKLIKAFGFLKIDSQILNKVLHPKKLWDITQNDKKMHKSKINFIIAKKKVKP